jgi:hypothetical protein
MSTDYYTRLEQARAPRPSRPVLTGLARALRLNDDERAHLFRLAGEQPGPPPGPPSDVRDGILRMIARLDVPGIVLDAKYDVLAWNRQATALLADFSALPVKERNLLRQRFLHGKSARFSPEATQAFAHEAAADLRAAAATYPDDPTIPALIADLLTGSPEFADIWSQHEVARQQTLCQTILHPEVGRIDVICEILLVPDRNQRVVLYTADPGSPSDQALRLLDVIGTQSLA